MYITKLISSSLRIATSPTTQTMLSLPSLFARPNRNHDNSFSYLTQLEIIKQFDLPSQTCTNKPMNQKRFHNARVNSMSAHTNSIIANNFIKCHSYTGTL